MRRFPAAAEQQAAEDGSATPRNSISSRPRPSRDRLWEELFSPLAGEVTAVNADLVTHPEAVNSQPHDTWMIKIKITSADELGGLLDATQYETLTQ